MANPVSTGTAKTMLHALGIAVQQAVMYGPVHNVSRLAAREASGTIADLLGPENGLEVAVAPQGAGAIVNGESVSSPDSAGQAFLARLEAHGVHELRFDPGFASSDAETFLALLAARPDSSAASGGFKASLERALPGGSVRVVESHWRKVGDDGVAAPSRPSLPKGVSALAGAADSLYGVRKGPASSAAPPHAAAPTGEGATLDLTAALAEAEPRFGASRREKDEAAASGAERREADKRAVAELLRRTADLLDRAGRPPEESLRREVLETIERALHIVEANAAGTSDRIGELSRQIEEDRATVESIEAASRRRGMGPQLTRAELLDRFGELGQEIVQPLTVATGAIDLVRKGKGGDLTDEQRSLLHLAAESLDRMQMLVDRIARIAGLPDGFSPDPDAIGAR
jgi:hypothetical protein